MASDWAAMRAAAEDLKALVKKHNIVVVTAIQPPPPPRPLRLPRADCGPDIVIVDYVGLFRRRDEGEDPG